jgi:hypothetical protein
VTDWQPAPFTPSAPEEPDGENVPIWVFGLLVVLLLVGGAVAANELLKLTKDDDGSDYPSAWDKRVMPYVKIAEKQRGLRFFHPVEVDFLSDADFEKQVTSKEEDLTDEDREEIEQATGMLRAIGLIHGDVDLFEEVNQLHGSAVIGLYSYKDERIRIRGKELGPAERSTLVHELTHALQDQHFDIGKHRDELDKDDESTSSETAYDALVEGDASRVETAYRESLSTKQRAALDRAQAKAAKGAGKKAADVPEIFKTLLGAPYAMGEAMLALAVKLDGNEAVNRLFRNPPETEEHLLDPWTLIKDHQDAAEVPAPKLGKGDDEFDSGDFGALGWYVVLAERLPLVTALDAVDGWGGDSYVAFERDGLSCVQVNYRADTKRDLGEMRAAVQAWVDAGPDGVANVALDGDQLWFMSCDPGKAAAAGQDASTDALQLALTRTYASLNLLKGGVPQEASRCVANRFVHDFPWRDLVKPTFGSSPAAEAKIRRIATGCR